MAKLYTLVNTPAESVQQNEPFPPSLLIDNTGLNDSNLDEVVNEYPFAKYPVSGSESYELREPAPTERAGNYTVSQIDQLQVLLTQATTLCDEMDKLVALHCYFYEAVESVSDINQACVAKTSKVRGSKVQLSLFPCWLRDCGFSVLDDMYTLQQSLRDICLKSKKL